MEESDQSACSVPVLLREVERMRGADHIMEALGSMLKNWILAWRL